MKQPQKRVTLKEVLEAELKDKEFRFYFEREMAVSQIARMIKTARLQAGLSQVELAKKAGTTQAVIARLESAKDSRIPSLELLERIALALKAKLAVSLEYPTAA